MKRLVLINIILFSSLFIQAGNPTENSSTSSVMVNGRVIDKSSGDEIVGAEIKIGDKTIYSDLEGKFTTIIATNTKEITIKYISYLDKVVQIYPFSYNTIELELSSK